MESSHTDNHFFFGACLTNKSRLLVDVANANGTGSTGRIFQTTS